MRRKKQNIIEEQDLLLKKSLRQQGRRKKGKVEGHVGRITNIIASSIGAPAFETSAFASKEQAERDKKILLTLQEKDGERFLDRQNKFVMISPYEMRVVAALSYIISDQIDADDVRDIINNPDKIKYVRRTVQLGDIAKVIHNKREWKDKLKIFTALRELDNLYQAFQFPNKIKLRPFFRIQDIDVDLNGTGHDTVVLDLGLVFFLNLDRSFTYLTPQVFIAWGKKTGGRQTELYGRLQFHLLPIVTNRKEIYYAAAKRLRNEVRYCKLKGDERKQFQRQKEEEIEQAKTEAMFYEINVENIKRKISTDYDDRRTKGKFKTHFEAAVEGYKEAGFILDGKLVKGKRGQLKAVFKLNLDYGTNLLPA